eukprot:457017-Pelagomonas_calceolata.AAC.2
MSAAGAVVMARRGVAGMGEVGDRGGRLRGARGCGGEGSVGGGGGHELWQCAACRQGHTQSCPAPAVVVHTTLRSAAAAGLMVLLRWQHDVRRRARGRGWGRAQGGVWRAVPHDLMVEQEAAGFW